jgi:hypothetical protein
MRTSASAVAASPSDFSPLAAAPSPAFSVFPLMSTAPRATWIQAWRPGRSAWAILSPFASSVV